MSKKKTSTKTDADQPAIVPMKRGGSAKKKGRAQPDAVPATTPPVTDTPAPEISAAAPAPALEAPAAEVPLAADVRPTPEVATADAAKATSDASQATAPAAEAPPADAVKGKKKAKAKKEPKPKKMGCLDAAAKVLADAGTPMTCQEMIEAMAKAKLWISPGGQTPSATLYSAILREIKTKGKDSRFKKTERGKFAAK